jgi:sporulation protein YunB
MKKTKRKLKFICFLVSVCTLSCFLYFSSNKILENLSLKSFETLISSSSYNAINNILAEGYDYKSLIDVSTNSNGEIVMVTTDSIKVTAIASLAATTTYNYLNDFTNRGVEVPIGAFTGIQLLSGFGKTIRMKLISVSSVKCEIISNFTEAGINQTRHTISINIANIYTIML